MRDVPWRIGFRGVISCYASVIPWKTRLLECLRVRVRMAHVYVEAVISRV
jgi:hypothetical protein